MRERWAVDVVMIVFDGGRERREASNLARRFFFADSLALSLAKPTNYDKVPRHRHARLPREQR